VIRTEHAVLLASLIPNARLLIVPGNHGDYLGELAAAGGDPARCNRRCRLSPTSWTSRDEEGVEQRFQPQG
jgi:hypothetical protein